MKNQRTPKTLLVVVLAIVSILFLSCGVSQKTKESEDVIAETEEASESEIGGAEEPAKEDKEPEEAVEEVEEIAEPEETGYSGLCVNPYFPVKPDTFWNYYVQNPSDTYEYISSFIEITEESFIEKIESEVFNADIKWQCFSEGIIQSQYSALMLEEDTQGMEFITEGYEGFTLPSPDKWFIGFKWDTKYRVKTTVIVEDEQISSTGDIIIKNEIVAIESVTVPAGTFPEAIKVDSDKNMTISTDIAGTSMSFNVYTDISSWYAEDTGLVKQISKAICGTTIIELLFIE